MIPDIVISEDSAMSWDMKKAILISEGVRRLLRCDDLSNWSVLGEHLEKFAWKMFNSGYNKGQVKHIIDKAVRKYEKMKNEDREGVRPIHRDENWKKREREEEKLDKQDNWYRGKKDEFEAPLFIPWTKNGELKRECQKIVDRIGIKVKVIEKTGTKMKAILQKSSIGMNKGCHTGCIVCKSGNKTSCLMTDVTYLLTCMSCLQKEPPVKTLYDGETVRTARTRAMEHMEKMRKKDNESALWNHAVECHDRKIPEIKVEITGTYLKKPLQRQLMESVRIDQTEADIRLNSKNEWHLPFSLRFSLELSLIHI